MNWGTGGGGGPGPGTRGVHGVTPRVHGHGPPGGRRSPAEGTGAAGRRAAGRSPGPRRPRATRSPDAEGTAAPPPEREHRQAAAGPGRYSTRPSPNPADRTPAPGESCGEATNPGTHTPPQPSRTQTNRGRRPPPNRAAGVSVSYRPGGPKEGRPPPRTGPEPPRRSGGGREGRPRPAGRRRETPKLPAQPRRSAASGSPATDGA